MPRKRYRKHKPAEVPCLLKRLDDDVLWQIYEELIPQQGLPPLSLTCKWVRESVKPVLFRSCRQDALRLTWERFIPRHLWPYIRILLFYGVWADIDPPRRAPDRDSPTFPLRQALFEMSQLTAVRIIGTYDRGVPRTAQAAALSHPHLRTFDVIGPLYAPLAGPDDVAIFDAAPLTRYRQLVEDFRRSRYSVADSLVLAVVLNQRNVQESLEWLEVPSEYLPILLIVRCRFPRLQRLALRGESWNYEKLVVDVFGQMPSLKELVLTLSHPVRMGLHRLCPPGWAGPLPWQKLETLSLTYPDPNDPVYSWLPNTLRHLVLSCWPRHHNFSGYDNLTVLGELGWSSPVQNYSAMLNILRRCECSQLDTLDIEFVGGESDMDLFRLIADAFPNLSSLTVYRYRPRHLVNVPVREIGETLRPLQRLRYLSLYLDFFEAPHIGPGWLRSGPVEYASAQEEHDRIMRIFDHSADIIARSLGPSLLVISFLLRGSSANSWISYRVQHSPDGFIVHLDPHAREAHGLLDGDDPTPSIPLL
ncbi:hypothetical protein FKP32DRAFT_1588795 [Trametes sanguinea]|nr:hypothetical protein FKP32DRAFT_1588795 [Trametes sanguinea]